MRVYKCDKCSKQMSEPKHIEIKGEQQEPAIQILAKMDLCQKCYDSIYSLIDDFVTYRA